MTTDAFSLHKYKHFRTCIESKKKDGMTKESKGIKCIKNSLSRKALKVSIRAYDRLQKSPLCRKNEEKVLSNI